MSSIAIPYGVGGGTLIDSVTVEPSTSTEMTKSYSKDDFVNMIKDYNYIEIYRMAKNYSYIWDSFFSVSTFLDILSYYETERDNFNLILGTLGNDPTMRVDYNHNTSTISVTATISSQRRASMYIKGIK